MDSPSLQKVHTFILFYIKYHHNDEGFEVVDDDEVVDEKDEVDDFDEVYDDNEVMTILVMMTTITKTSCPSQGERH